MARVLDNTSASADPDLAPIALRISVTGIVQGVGFRPFVHRLALRHGLSGWVRNADDGVQIEVEGLPSRIGAFLRDIRGEAPPLVRIDELLTSPSTPSGHATFVIARSATASDDLPPVPPDLGICARCEAELFDPADRRYHYPFIACADCGPRFTVLEAMPYRRESTSLRTFRPCPECATEYASAGDRRYRAETNGCSRCGPTVWLTVSGETAEATGAAAVPAAAARLLRGEIVAIRGLGGFHLAADATSDAALARLRARKGRRIKPFALMARTVEDVDAIAVVSAEERALLRSAERPVVLLERRPDGPLAAAVAPGLGYVGVMLPHTPLHHLVLDAVGRPLVMTGGSSGDEPIAIGNAEALDRLGGIADAWLLHDREIVSRYDDSVVRVAAGAPVVLRRARGYAPVPIALPAATPRPLIAVGPHRKNTFTLAHHGTAYVSQHIGDLESLETLEHFGTTYDLHRALFHIEPEIAVRDLHPDYLSTRIAAELGLERIIEVQHHHAHLAAVMGEHGVTAPVVGVAFDGAGYGDDRTVWGAEIMVVDLTQYRRVAHLRQAPLPGGDVVARYPWRAALGYASLDAAVAPSFALAFAGVAERERAAAERQVAREVNSPFASSMGRLFDAAAAVLGVRQTADYEGQAVMELEALAGRRTADALPFTDLDPLPLLAALGERRLRGDDAGDLAAAFHESVAAGAADTACRIAADAGLDTVVLGGDLFQNARLLATTRERLERCGLRVLVPLQLGPNDGAVSYGQAAVAAARLWRESTA